MIPPEGRQPPSVCACQDPWHPRPSPSLQPLSPGPLAFALVWEESKSLQRTSQTQLSRVWSHLWGSPGSCNTARTVPGTLLSLSGTKDTILSVSGTEVAGKLQGFTGENTLRQVLTTCCGQGPVLGQDWAGNLQSLIASLLIIRWV